jgi:hypothetical protein
MTGSEPNEPRCLYCNRTADEVPLLVIEYQGRTYRICPQHLPILIHKPAALAGLLPGAESFAPGEHADH